MHLDFWITQGDDHLTAHEYEEAVKAYAQATELSPDSPEIWLSLAAALNGSNQCQEALQAIDKAVGLSPNLGDETRLLLEKAEALNGLDKYQEALEIANARVMRSGLRPP